MKKHLYILVVLLCPLSLLSQAVEIEGKLKVSEMDTINTENLLVVKRPDGTLAARQVASLPPPPGDTARTLERDFLLTATLCNCTNLPPAMIQSLLDNGYSHEDLIGFNTSIADMIAGGVSVADIIAGGGSVQDLLAEGFSIANLLAAGASILYLIDGGVLIVDLLSIGLSPIYLWGEGVILDSLYGKLYEEGLIFYLDTGDQFPSFEGLVAYPFEFNLAREWGCYGIDVFGAEGIGIGTGVQNTIDIVDEFCYPQPNAGLDCSEFYVNAYDDWFLPSRNELAQMYYNLALKGFGEFTNNYYYSSTEYNNNNAWYQSFYDGSQFFTSKNNNTANTYFRPVRAF